MGETVRTALVTGGNRGIGLAVAEALARRGVEVLLGARDPRLGEEAAGALRERRLPVRAVEVDVADPESIRRCVEDLAAARIRVDALVNNAGVFPEGSLMARGDELLRAALEVHVFGPLALARAFVPGMRAAGRGRVVNVSSGCGSFGEGLEGPAAYCVSKAALNALTVKLAAEAGPVVKVNACCPGWVQTRMGGPEAERTPEEGAETIVWLATLPDDGPTGGFFRDRKRLPW